MTPKEIKAVLAEVGGGPNKRLGQHFLIDREVLKTMVESADIKADDLVLEIGPGLGVLTQALLLAGASVIAIERDRRYLTYLNRRFAEAIDRGRLTLIEGDAMRVDWAFLLKNRAWKFVSNLPYSITSFALRQALYSLHPPQSLTVLIQKEVAERAIAKDGYTSLLSLMISLATKTQSIVKRVPAGAFYPPPKVQSAVLSLHPYAEKERQKKWGIEPEEIMLFAKKGFAHPRKKLFSNLEVSPDQLKSCEWIVDNALIRAEAVSVERWVELAKALKTLRKNQH